MANHGPSARWGDPNASKTRYPRLKLVKTLLAPPGQCDCKPGECKAGARECRDWIKRAANQQNNKG